MTWSFREHVLKPDDLSLILRTPWWRETADSEGLFSNLHTHVLRSRAVDMINVVVSSVGLWKWFSGGMCKSLVRAMGQRTFRVL